MGPYYSVFPHPQQCYQQLMGAVSACSFLSLPASEHRREDSGARKIAKILLYLGQLFFSWEELLSFITWKQKHVLYIFPVTFLV